MQAAEFVDELAAANRELLDRLAGTTALEPDVEPGSPLTVGTLLKVALRNEMEATDLAARWLATTPPEEVDVKLGLARQAGDEAKHYRLIVDRLEEMGEDLSAFSPLAGGYSPLFHYLDTLETTVERVAAGQFTRESIAEVKNEQFIVFCETVGDDRTAALYRDIIQPDEHHHHLLGRRLLLDLADTTEKQDAARAAARWTLDLAEELTSLARERSGTHHAPGC
jgi:uncharacterized ferritin-like protein (DUF455 family)